MADTSLAYHLEACICASGHHGREVQLLVHRVRQHFLVISIVPVSVLNSFLVTNIAENGTIRTCQPARQLAIVAVQRS